MKFRDLTSGGGKNFLRLKPGEEIRGIFRGDPVDFRQHWHNNRGSVCTGRDRCDLCKAGEKSAFRFRLNFIVKENGAYVAKIFEQGKAVYEQLQALHADYNLETNQMKIRRVGSGTETTYSILPVPNGTVTEEFIKAMETLKLNDLSPFGQSSAPAPEPEQDEEEHHDDIPF